jgi:hypothetical protein
MRKLLGLILFSVNLSVFTFGQSGYYATDSTMLFGVRLVDGGALTNSEYCQVKKGEEIVKYTPYEIKEYALEKDRVYVSKEINTGNTPQRVFLEQLVKGNITLFYYRGKGVKTYFVEKDSSLFMELTKFTKHNPDSSFNATLSSITNDCSNVAKAIKHVKYNKRSLTKFFTRYNDCELRPSPFFRYGFNFIVGHTRLTQTRINSYDYLGPVVFTKDNSLSIGLFGEIQIMNSNLSIRPEIYLQKNGFSGRVRIDNTIHDYVINTHSIVIPLMLRYTYPSMRFSYFGNIGFVYCNNFHNSNLDYLSTISEDIIDIERSDLNIIRRHQLGNSLGMGVQYKLGSKKQIFTEMRYTHFYKATNTFGSNNFQILVGLSF